MYVLRSKSTGVTVGWNRYLWKTGNVELTEVAGGKTPQKVLNEIQEVTGQVLQDTNPNPSKTTEPAKKSRKPRRPRTIIEEPDFDISGFELDATNDS